MKLRMDAAQPLGRYSFLVADPFEWIEVAIGTDDPLARIRDLFNSFQLETLEGLPPFQGGVAGLLSYDLNKSFEPVRGSQTDEFEMPAMAVGCYDTVIAWDHLQDSAWIVSTGLPETDEDQRAAKANSRIEFFERLLNYDPSKLSIGESSENELADLNSVDPLNQFPVPGPSGLTSNFSQDSYIEAVKKCIDYIYAGDVFQINLAQRLLFPANCESFELFQRLRACNPAPFGGYFDLSHFSKSNAQIISASPERFFSVRNRVVETRPIKGTRRRTGTPMVDIQAKQKLTSSVKDRAENTMIVDLMRNDLSRCCADESIQVTQLCELEEYRSVFHLVSAVEGQLKPDCGLVDLVESIFPGGSITGAPKVRAMEIIAQLEPHTRGAYCGGLGYLGFDGSADFNILIRTITASRGWWQIPVGGGIVSQSDPHREYEETWTKAASMLRAFGSP